MSQILIALCGALLLIAFGAACSIIFIYIRKNMNPNIDISKEFSANERRKALRRALPCKAFVRRILPDGGINANEFSIRDISSGGLYMYTDSPSAFGLAEEIEVTIEVGRAEYYAGKAYVVHSQAVFDEKSSLEESGIGVRFLGTPKDFVKIN